MAGKKQKQVPEAADNHILSEAKRQRVNRLTENLLAELDKHEAEVAKAAPTVKVSRHAVRPFTQVVRARPWTRRNTVQLLAFFVVMGLIYVVQQIPIPPSKETQAWIQQADMAPLAPGEEDPRVAAEQFTLKMAAGWTVSHVYRAAHPDFWRRLGETDPNSVANRILDGFVKIQATCGPVVSASAKDHRVQMTFFRNRDKETIAGWVVPLTVEFSDGSTRPMSLLLVKPVNPERGWAVWDIRFHPFLK